MSTFFFLLLCFILSNPPPSSAQKTLSAFSVSDSPWGPLHNQTLLSPNSLFAAGFLALPTSPNLFNFSIWYRNISAAVVWSANPIKSPVGPNATLSFTAVGALRLVNSSSSIENLWPGINESWNYSNRTSLVLRNDDNLIYGDWQSFDFPTDTVLPNQNITISITLVSNNDNFIFTNSTKLMVFNQTEDYQHWDNAFQKLDSYGKMMQANGESFIFSDFGLNRSRRLTLDNDGNLRIYSFNPSIAD